MASVTFGGVVLVVGLVTLFFALMGSAGYFTTSKIYSFLTGKELKDLFRFLPLIGTFFDKEEEVTPTHSGFKSNGYSTKILPYSDEEEEDEDEDEGNVEILSEDNNESDIEQEETKSATNFISDSSDPGIDDSSVEQEFTDKPSTEVENGEKVVKGPEPIIPQTQELNGYQEEEAI